MRYQTSLIYSVQSVSWDNCYVAWIFYTVFAYDALYNLTKYISLGHEVFSIDNAGINVQSTI